MKKGLTNLQSRYLEQVENRLADVEEEINRLKRLVPNAIPNGKQHVIQSRSTSSRRDHPSESPYGEDSLHVEDGSLPGISPDATDGVGTIEFGNEETWAYFGMMLSLVTRCFQDLVSSPFTDLNVS